MKCPACQADNDGDAETCFTCGQGLFAVTAGTVLSGRYRIVRLLGRGGMGTVYEAHDGVLDEQVAVKVLRGELARSAEVMRRFRSEIKLARRVRHRNVCAIHEYGEHKHLRFITMEFVDGVNLREVLEERGRLPPEEALDVAGQIVDGLQAIQQIGIVHRDLKTANVMMGRDGVVRVMDFGLAKQVDGGSGSQTTSGLVVGTPKYMSPEQARGERTDFRSDLYSVGVVLFELLTGDVPFRGDTPMSILFGHLHTPPPLGGPEAAPIPPPIVSLLAKALAKSPGERYASAAEMAAALAGARIALGEAATVPAPAAALPTAVPPLPPTLVPVVPPRSPQADVDGLGETMPDVPTPVPHRPRAWVWAVAAMVLVTAGLAAAAALLGRPDAPPLGDVARREVTPPPATASEPIGTPSEAAGPASVPSAPLLRAETPPPRLAARPSAPPTARPAAPLPVTTTAPAKVLPAPTAPAPAGTGQLQVRVRPWADVTVDGSIMGTTPLKPLDLAAGVHQVLLVHPDYAPLPRTVTIRAGETTKLDVNLAWEGVRKEPR